MKAWQTQKSGMEVTAKPKDTNALLGSFHLSFQKKPKFWQAVGKRRSRVCQFSLAGGAPESWYVSVDETGGVVFGGVHPSPDATWASDAAALLAIMRLEVAGGELVRQGKIRLTGDLALLQELLEALDA